ncbi:MAG: hypothetical protein NC131_06530 [Roseburia sp.]|nr:hypothetical protein [Roseburia sp.]
MGRNMEEYRALREEIQMRINNLYGQNFTIVTLIVAVWAFVVSGYSDLIDAAPNIVLIFPVLLIVGGIIVNFLFGQWKENFQGIASLAGYIIVFFEMPSIMSDGNGEDKMQWETFTACSLFADKRNTGFANKTFIVVSIGSVLLAIGLAIHYFLSKWCLIFSQPGVWIIFGFCCVAVVLWIYTFKEYLTKLNIWELKMEAVYRQAINAVKQAKFPPEKVKKYFEEYLFNEWNFIDKVNLKEQKVKISKLCKTRSKKKNKSLRETIISSTEYKNFLKTIFREEK